MAKPQCHPGRRFLELNAYLNATSTLVPHKLPLRYGLAYATCTTHGPSHVVGLRLYGLIPSIELGGYDSSLFSGPVESDFLSKASWPFPQYLYFLSTSRLLCAPLSFKDMPPKFECHNLIGNWTIMP